MGSVHEHKLEIGQRSDQVLLVGIGVAPSTQGLGPQQFTCHLLVSGAISDKHLSYGSRVGPEAAVHFGHDTRVVQIFITNTTSARGKGLEAFPGCQLQGHCTSRLSPVELEHARLHN